MFSDSNDIVVDDDADNDFIVVGVNEDLKIVNKASEDNGNDNDFVLAI